MAIKPHEILDEIREAEDQVTALQHRFLRSMGWEETCDTGALWLWKKEINGKHMRVSLAAAMHLAEDECPYPVEETLPPNDDGGCLEM